MAAVNKHMDESQESAIDGEFENAKVVMYSISGNDKDSYNDIDRNEVTINEEIIGRFESGMKITLKPHSVNVIQIIPE